MARGTGFWQAADDTVRVAANGLTFGLADKATGAITGEDEAARTAAARENLGVAGDVINAATYLAGPLGALKLGKAAWAAGKTLPALMGAGGRAATAVGTKAVRAVNPTFVGNTTARARLGLAPAQGMASKAASAVRSGAATAKANPWKTAGAAGAVAFGTSVGHNSRTENNQSAVTPAKAVAAPAGKAAAAEKAADPAAQAAEIAKLLGEGAGQPSFEDMMGDVAAAQGGQISLRQMGALAEMQQRTTPKAVKPAAPGDAAGRMLEEMYTTQFSKALQDPNADPVKAQEEFEQKILQLRKTQFNTLQDQLGFEE
jgi:hypothetical protein